PGRQGPAPHARRLHRRERARRRDRRLAPHGGGGARGGARGGRPPRQGRVRHAGGDRLSAAVPGPREPGDRRSVHLGPAGTRGRRRHGGELDHELPHSDDVLAFWRDKEGAALTPEALRPHFEEVERRLGIQKVDLEEVNANNRALYDGCKKLGWSVDTISRNVRGCLRTGYCGMGCPVDAKQSAALTYLPDAV